MQFGYIIKITGNSTYNEAQLSTKLSAYSIGTKIDSDMRFRKELFFEDFQVVFINQNGQWNVSCTDNIYLDFNDVRKFATKQLIHGDSFSIKYRNSENEIFKIEFVYDFDNENKDYTRVIEIQNINKILIGSSANSNIVLNNTFLDNGCFDLTRVNNNEYSINVIKSGYGIYHNGHEVSSTKNIKDGDFISISNFSFYIKEGHIYTSRDVLINGLKYYDLIKLQDYPKFNRNTRIKSKLNIEKIEILDPPKAPQKPTGNIVTQLLPALAMIALTVVVRGFMADSSGSSFIIFSVCSMGLGIVTTVISMVSDRKKYKKEVSTRIEKYNEYINQKREQIKSYRIDELKRLNYQYTNSQTELDNISKFSGEIFDKTTNDDDFLNIRLGTGIVEAKREIAYKKQEKFESEDELSCIPEKIYEEFKYIADAPITLDIKTNGVIGVIGDSHENYLFLKKIILDIISRHYYNDVSLFFLINEKDSNEYSRWLKWIPHIIDDRTKMRNIVYDSNSKSSVFERLYVNFGKRLSDETEKMPHYVIFVLDEWGIKTHPVSQYISFAEKCNASFIFFENKKEELPLYCSKIVELEQGCKGQIISTDNKDVIDRFVYSKISDFQIEKAIKMISPVYCEEITLENALTKNITLFEMLNIISVEDINLRVNWSSSEIHKTMAAPLGVKTKNEKVYLDLHEKAHGPHGLVAGTTGSGKSEILQTYILAMATLYHPYEVGFVIIDFKGGGMANQFKSLPHLVGTITNIDGKEINRSLMSIKAELEKRQRLFAENDVNNISSYIEMYKRGKAENPIPHLIIIVDEFAELKAEQPDFMKELISAARIGRSLGVHLVLATQKPAGQVNEQIWSNSKFKLCLKVQTKEDSNEVLKSPLAAEIKEPGRAYLQVGNNEIFELFQSAYSGAPARGEDASAEKEYVICEVDLQGKRKVVFQKKTTRQNDVVATQLDAIVKYINEYCEKEEIKKLPSICLPPLPDVIDYKNNDRHKSNELIVAIGTYDDPGHQSQEGALLNISAGNTVIVGSSQFGKTNLLQVILRSIAENNTPSETNIYVLDFGSMALKSFEQLNHIGGIVTSSEDEKVKHLFRLLSKEIVTRKEIFAKLGITSFNSYLEAGHTDIPRIVLVVDNFIAFRELYSEYEEEMITLCREGISIGISIIATTPQTNGIGYKYMSNFSNRVCMFCNSSEEYSALFDRCRMEPKAIPGRCLIQLDKQIFETQTYISFCGEKEIDRVKAIQEFVALINGKNEGQVAKQIPSIPKLLDYGYIESNYHVKKPYQVVVGLNYETIDPIIIDLIKTGTIGVTGREGGGKTNLIRLIFNYCLSNVFEHPTKAYIIDGYNRQLELFSSYGFVEKYTIDVAALELILPEIEEELCRRKEMVQELGPDVLEKEPLIICAIETQSVFENGTLSNDAINTYKRIIANYKSFKILFMFTNIPNVSIGHSASEFLKQIKDVNITFVMDDLSNAKFIDVNATIARQYKKPIELGDAYCIQSDGTISKNRIIKGET